MRLLRAADEAESQSVRGMNAVCHVALHAVQKARAIDVCGDAVIEEIAQKIGREAHAAQPREIGKLRVDVADGFLNRRDIIIMALNLVLVDQLRWKIAYPKGGERWRLPWRI